MDEKDDDSSIIVVNEPTPLSPLSSPAAAGMKINLHKALDIAESKELDNSMEAEMERKSKSEVLIMFELPDGSQVEEKFMLGHTVEVLKAFLSSECDMDFQSKLFIEDKLLLDPMQLADYIDSDSKDDIYVRVEGEMEDVGRK